MKSPVYEEYRYKLIQSGHGSKVYYRVFEGTVNWDKSAGGMKRAITVLMQYGNAEEWRAATKEISFDMPAHILLADLPKVLAAINELSTVAIK